MSAGLKAAIERWIEARIAGGIESALASRDLAKASQALESFQIQWRALDEAEKMRRRVGNGSAGVY
jgi:hypothetical protein